MDNTNIIDLNGEQQEIINKTLANLGIEDEEGKEIFNEFIKLLAQPDEVFDVIAPTILEQYSVSMNDPNVKLAVSEGLVNNLETYNQLKDNLTKSFDEIDNSDLSSNKKSFLKQVLNILVNTINGTTGTANRIVQVAYEKCNEDAKEPAYAHISDSGLDVYALEDITINPGETKLIPIGIKAALPPGYEFQVRPKSGRCLKTKLRVANAPGTIDAGYRDEIAVIIDNIDAPIKSFITNEDGTINANSVEYGSAYTIGKGEKFAQLVLAEVPKAVMYEVEDVLKVDDIDMNRGGGFGSTGLK